MAFYIHSTEDGHVPAWEYLPVSAISGGVKPGMAMLLTSGKLAKATATNKPTFICMADTNGANTAADDIIPVIRVTPDIVFETISSAAMSSRKIGDKVTIADDAMRVTATDTSGVAEIVDILDSASGGAVRVRF